MPRKIVVLDTTLRDGEQAPGCSMNIQEKLEMAKQLERLGVDIIEAGFPVTSPEDFQAVQQVAQTIKNTTVTGLSRAVRGDIDRAYEALRVAENPMLHIVIATSDIHLQHKLKMSRQQMLEKMSSAIAYAKTLCPLVQFSAEDAFRSDPAFLLEVLNEAIRQGATSLSIPDTVGYATAAEVQQLVSYLNENLINRQSVRLAIHCHNDLGQAVANTLMAVSAGADQIECTINGIGERAGNTSLEETVMALHTRKAFYQCECGIKTKQLYRTSKLLSTITGIGVAPNKPVVGANAFAHEAGIHQHGILNNRATYEIMSPSDIGIPESRVVLGKHSGRHAFIERLTELGYSIHEKEMDAAFEKFKQLADRKKNITDRDLEALIGPFAISIPETYTLDAFVINSGTIISATAVVKLIRDGIAYEQVARGEGPIDAAYKAIDQIVNNGYHLDNYSIQAITDGEDALGEAIVKIRKEDDIVTGRGLSTDILEASIKAYINAINKTLIS